MNKNLLLFKIIFMLPGLVFIIAAAVYCYITNQDAYYRTLAAVSGGLLAATYLLIIFWQSKSNLLTAAFFMVLGLTAFAIAGREIYFWYAEPEYPPACEPLTADCGQGTQVE